MENTQVNSNLNYLPELNSLRALAVFMTLLAHFSPVEIPYMWYGVPIFFTISGFLITAILINSYNNKKNTSRGKIIGNFMIRRVLRLFPLYYLFITVFWVALNYFHLYLWLNEFNLYFFTYLPNFKLYQIGFNNAVCFSHLWSLGVEEQFYLFWPWVILFSPQKMRIPFIVCLILFSIIFIFFHSTDVLIGAFPFVNFHTLGVGALLACFYTQNGNIINWLKQKRHWLFLITFIHLLLVLIFFNDKSPWWHLYREIALCIWTFCIVLVTIFGWKGWIGLIARNKSIQYIGTISYGIYVLHMPVTWLYRIFLSHVAPNLHVPQFISLPLYFLISFGLAVLSYKFIEMPFLKLKKYFN